MQLNNGEVILIKIIIWGLAISGWVIIFRFIFQGIKLIFKRRNYER
jgi:hypothetical protein